jgi:hypothetical protein
VDSGYTTPQTPNSWQSPIYLKVAAKDAASGGTYSIKYGPVGLVLTGGQWQDGEITSAGEIQYYHFSVTSGAQYQVYWNDNGDGDSTKTLNIQVSALYGSTGTAVFTNQDNGYSVPQSFTASSNNSVVISVRTLNTGNTGTYSIKYQQQ